MDYNHKSTDMANQFSNWVVWQFRREHIVQTTNSNKSLMHTMK